MYCLIKQAFLLQGRRSTHPSTSFWRRCRRSFLCKKVPLPTTLGLGFLMCPLRSLGPQACHHGAAALFFATHHVLFSCSQLFLGSVLHQSNATHSDFGGRWWWWWQSLWFPWKQGVVSLLHTTHPVSVTLVDWFDMIGNGTESKFWYSE